MKILKKAVELESKDYYYFNLVLLNSLSNNSLTNREIEIIASFMSLKEDITRGDIFNTYARKIVKNMLGMSAGSLSNHIKSLLEKGFLSKDEVSGRISIHKSLFPDKEMQGYQIKLINKL